MADLKPAPRAAPRDPAPAGTAPARAFVVLWGLAWAIVGCAVAGGIVLSTDLDAGPALQTSILFAEVVGFTALVSARLIFPLFVRLPYALSLLLQVLTLLSGTLFGSVAVAALFPLLSLRQYRLLALIVLVNASLAVVVGIALYTYDTMRRQIEHSFRDLRRKEAMERELSIARDVQQQLLPTAPPRIEGLELAGVCIPAIGVGGDYYDYLPLGDGGVGLVVADVSGKGVPAALLMAGLQASMRTLARPGAAPAEIATQLNEILYRSSAAARYATLFIGFYDTASRALRYSNAGHHPPLVVGRRGPRDLTQGGMPIGMFERAVYAEGCVELDRGDLVALFTDGVVEAPNPAGEEFGRPRLTTLLAGLAGRPLDEVMRLVLDDLNSWSAGGEAHDDVTLVLARIT